MIRRIAIILCIILFAIFAVYFYLTYSFTASDVIIIHPASDVSFKKRVENPKGIKIFGSDKRIYDVLDNSAAELLITRAQITEKPIDLEYQTSQPAEAAEFEPINTNSIFATSAKKKYEYQIRLGMVLDKESGMRLWKKLEAENKTVLRHMQPEFDRIKDREGNVFYYLIVSGFKTFQKANAVCRRVRAAGSECIIHMPLGMLGSIILKSTNNEAI